MIQHYLDPENCPLYGNLPTLSQLVNLKQNNPSKYEELVNDGTVKRAVNIKALKHGCYLVLLMLINLTFYESSQPIKY